MLQGDLQPQVIRTKEETLKRHIDLYMRLRKIERVWLFGLFLLELACLCYLVYMGGCYDYSDGCYGQEDSRISECSSACSLEGQFIITLVIFGTFMVYAAKGCGRIDSKEDLADKICINVIELVPTIGIIGAAFEVHGEFLSDPGCNGFSAGSCTIRANSAVNIYDITAFAWIPLAAALFVNIFLICYATIVYHRPNKAQNRPFLVVAVTVEVEVEEND